MTIPGESQRSITVFANDMVVVSVCVAYCIDKLFVQVLNVLEGYLNHWLVQLLIGDIVLMLLVAYLFYK